MPVHEIDKIIAVGHETVYHDVLEAEPLNGVEDGIERNHEKI